MSLRSFVHRMLRPIATPVLDRIASRVARRLGGASVRHDAGQIEFEIALWAALRSLTISNDYRYVPPFDSARASRRPKEIKIGFFGNMANNAYNFTKCLRRLGYDAELVIEDGYFDAFLMNRPFWEDLEVECNSYEEGLTHEHRWVKPDYVRRVAHDPEMQARFQGRFSAVPEVQTLYRQVFGMEVTADHALVLAQQMGHWPYLMAMIRYDVVQLSGAPICLGAFCPRPYVVFPTGSDLFLSPFQETLFGMLMRAGYRTASHLLVGEPNYPEYLDRLAVSAPRTYSPVMIDTDTYVAGKCADVRTSWMKEIGGNRFILGVCRQDWNFKANDRLIRAFSTFVHDASRKEWRLVLMQWGRDVDAAKQLIDELGLTKWVLWKRLASKPLVRRYQQAADLVGDQFAMPGYGTSVVESMAAGCPVLMRPQDGHLSGWLQGVPPFLGASQPEEIHAKLEEIADDRCRELKGTESLDWVNKHHGYRSVGRIYIEGYRSALHCS